MTQINTYDGLYALTPRQEKVAGLLVHGLTNPQIADRLSISCETVKSHVAEILSKLSVSSRKDVGEALMEVRKDGN